MTDDPDEPYALAYRAQGDALAERLTRHVTAQRRPEPQSIWTRTFLGMLGLWLLVTVGVPLVGWLIGVRF